MELSDFEAFRKSAKKILVTGHTGFKGTWLTLLLEHLGLEVHGLSLAPTEGSLYQRMKRKGVINEYFEDIRYVSNLEKCVKEIRPNIIFHLAAQPLVLESYRNPLETFETNVLGTANLLDTAFKSEVVELVAVITTDKVYANDNSGKMFTETDELKGKDPYSASKVGTESVVAAWQHLSKVENGPKFISLRAGNVIGGGDFAKERLIPDMIRSLSTQSEISLRNPSSTRPWQHVLDPLIGYLMSGQKSLEGHGLESLNFAPDGVSLTVRQVADIVLDEWGIEYPIHLGAGGEQLEATTLQLDASEAKNLLGWQPHWSQEGAIRATAKWWQQVMRDELTAQEACARDIRSLFK